MYSCTGGYTCALPSLLTIGEQPARGGANYLRQQWATHTQPKLYVARADKQDQERAHQEGGVGVREGGGSTRVRESVRVWEGRGEERKMHLREQTLSGTTTGEDVFCVCCVWGS